MDSSSVEYVPCQLFELSVTQFGYGPVTNELRIATLDEFDAQLHRVENEVRLAIGLTALDPDECEWGSFWLLINGDRAWVHLVEGQCLTARDATSVATGAQIDFLDDAGNEKQVPLSETVSRQQGLRALRHWLPDGEKLPELSWTRA